MKNKKKSKKILNKIIGIVLILFAIIPTPDDITVISPIIAFTVGVAFITGDKVKW